LRYLKKVVGEPLPRVSPVEVMPADEVVRQVGGEIDTHGSSGAQSFPVELFDVCPWGGEVVVGCLCFLFFLVLYILWSMGLLLGVLRDYLYSRPRERAVYWVFWTIIVTSHLFLVIQVIFWCCF